MPNLYSSGYEPLFDPRDHAIDLVQFPNRSKGRGESIRLYHPIPPRNQGNVNCCMSCALAMCMEILDFQLAPAKPLNVLFHYWAARKLAGRAPTDNRGMSFQLGFDALLTHGICQRGKHLKRISTESIQHPPSQAARRDADRHRIAGSRGRWAYQRIWQSNRVNAFRTLLRARHPIALGFYRTDAYHAINENGMHHQPTQPSNELHVATIIGYHNRKTTPLGHGAFYIKDSRGAAWAMHGNWWLPYSLVNSPLIRDAWTITEINY